MSDALAELEALLPALPAAIEQQKLGDRLAQAVAELRDVEQQARRLRALLAVAGDVGFGTGEQAATLEEARETALDVAKGLETADDPESLRHALWEYTKSLPPALTAFDRAVRGQWRTVFEKEFRPLLNLGELLSKIDATRDLGATMLACANKAAGLELATPHVLADGVRQALQERAQVDAARDTDIGGDIGAFLEALAERRATLAMITPDVHVWLVGQGALERFSVSPV